MPDAWKPEDGLNLEVGQTGLESYGGWISDEWHPRLRGRKGARVFREMRDNDPILGAIFHAMESLIVGAKWSIVPAADPATPEQIAAAEFVASVVADMEHTVDDMIWEILTQMTYGWAYMERVRKRRKDGRIGWKKIALRGQNSLDHWGLTDRGEITGMWQQLLSSGGGSVFIPSSKAVHFRTRKDRNNPEGRSLLRNAVVSYYRRERLQEIEGIGHERNLAGMPVARVPPEMLAPGATASAKTIITNLKKLVQQIHNDERGGMVIPGSLNRDGSNTGFEFDLLASSGKSVTDINPAIERYDSRIALSLLGQFLLLGQATQVGSYALAESGTNLFVVAIVGQMDGIAQTLTKQAIGPLCDVNGIARGDRPKWVHGDVDQLDLGRFGSYVINMLNAGVITKDERLEAKVREVGGLPPAMASAAPEAAPTLDENGDPIEAPEGETAEPAAPTAEGGAIELAPTDVAIVVTVDEARASQGLPPWPNPEEGALTVSEFKARKEGEGAAVGEAEGEAAAEEIDPNAPPEQVSQAAIPEDLMGAKAIGKRLGVSSATIHGMARRKEIGVYRVGSQLRYSLAEIMDRVSGRDEQEPEEPEALPE